MNYTLQEKDGQPYIECRPDGGRIENEQDAVDLVGICGEEGTQRLMLYAENLTDAFFDLKTGVAGAILLKFAIYQLIVAAVLSPQQGTQGKFHEMVLETNRGRQFRVFHDRQQAEQWLVSV